MLSEAEAAKWDAVHNKRDLSEARGEIASRPTSRRRRPDRHVRRSITAHSPAQLLRRTLSLTHTPPCTHTLLWAACRPASAWTDSAAHAQVAAGAVRCETALRLYAMLRSRA